MRPGAGAHKKSASWVGEKQSIEREREETKFLLTRLGMLVHAASLVGGGTQAVRSNLMNSFVPRLHLWICAICLGQAIQ